MSGRVVNRRGTRHLLIAGIALLAVIAVGTDLLLRAMPTVDDRPALRVADVPTLAIREVTGCTRADDTTVAELRAMVPPDGRIGSAQVHACPAAFDGLRVVYVGEVIGELLPRRGGVWVQVNDDAYALRVGPVGGHRDLRGSNTGLSVWLPDGLHEGIDGLGRPGVRGEVVSLTGRLLRADPADGGGITLRADRLETLAPAIAVEEPVHVLQALIAGILAVVALSVSAWAWWFRRN